MRNSELREYLENIYWKNNQTLNFKGWYAEVDDQNPNYKFDDQEIFVDDGKESGRTFIRVQTLLTLFPSELGYKPYCYKDEYDWFVVTIPEFRELTHEDIGYALHYIVKEVIGGFVWNISYEDKLMRPKPLKFYTYSSDELHGMRDIRKQEKENANKKL